MSASIPSPLSAFAPLKNDSFLRALLRQPTDHTPVWLMRQAGRYMPEYRATRARAGSFMNLCTTPELACEVTLQPIDAYALDAAILFSDILTIPDAMGLGLYFSEGEGPRFKKPVRSEDDVKQLYVPDISTHLRYVTDAVTLIRKELNGRVPLIGFSGSPWTLACYMVEGSGSDDYRLVKTMMYQRPDLMHQILSVTAQAVAHYLNAQIAAGAQAVMIFDSWGGVLADGAFQKFSLAYMKQVVDQLTLEREEPLADAMTGGATGNATRRARVPSIIFTKGGGQWLEELAATGCDALGLDWTTNLGNARSRVGHRVALQGNLDPMALMASPAQIEGEVAKVLESFGLPQVGYGHVFNLGHGISQHTPPQNVGILVDAVHAYSRRQRA